MAKKNEVAKREDNALALPEDMAALFEEGAGAGMEEIGADDIQLPMLKQVQDISDERDEDDPAYIEGADSGDFFNSVTRELYKGDLEIIPCSTRKAWVAFKPRAMGGGFLGEFESKEQATDFLTEPAELNETREVAVLYRPADDEDAGWTPAVFPATSSKLKPVRALMTQLLALRVPVGEGKSVQPPMYGTIFQMSSVKAKSQKGSYRNISFRFLRLVQDKELLEEAKKFGEVMSQREYRQPQDEAVFGDAEDDDNPPF